jgi:HTH-type transcriptional regulator/antitoxin HigA
VATAKIERSGSTIRSTRQQSRSIEIQIKPIRNEADYDAALAAINSLMGAPADTPEGDALDVLVTLVEAYEAERWPVEAPDPIALVREYELAGTA